MPHAITIKETEGKPGQVYYPLQLNIVPKPSPGHNELLVKLHAAGLNPRDVSIRQHQYSRISFRTPMLCDGYGTVVKTGPGCTSTLLHKPVILTPCRGWGTNPDGPEDWAKFCTIGGVDPFHHLGTAQNYIVVHESQVEPCPEHLNAVEGAALPACGLTAWRALVTKSGNAEAGHNILVTGIGGGVALQVLQFGKALGCNMYVTSGTETKLAKAVQLGAKGGVMYTSKEWHIALGKMLPAERPYLDAVIDGTGGDIVFKVVPILKTGGVIVCYDMTIAPAMGWPIQAVLKNIELRGSTLGSRKEFRDMVNFIREKKIRPVISRTVKGLECVDAIDGLFEELRTGHQFGKLVTEI